VWPRISHEVPLLVASSNSYTRFVALLNWDLLAAASAVAPAGEETNWLQTVPCKSWIVSLRLYGTLQSWFDKTWRPSEMELVN
jgi:hypothetical protein